MSRFDCLSEPDDDASFLRACGFWANVRRHIAGKAGRKLLLELEAALLALPEKRLERSTFARKYGAADDLGGVCALGALALARMTGCGIPRREAIDKMVAHFGDADDQEGWTSVEESAHYLGVKEHFTAAVIEQNDEYGGPTPEATYQHVLAWVRRRLEEEGRTP